MRLSAEAVCLIVRERVAGAEYDPSTVPATRRSLIKLTARTELTGNLPLGSKPTGRPYRRQRRANACQRARLQVGVQGWPSGHRGVLGSGACPMPLNGLWWPWRAYDVEEIDDQRFSSPCCDLQPGLRNVRSGVMRRPSGGKKGAAACSHLQTISGLPARSKRDVGPALVWRHWGATPRRSLTISKFMSASVWTFAQQCGRRKVARVSEQDGPVTSSGGQSRKPCGLVENGPVSASGGVIRKSVSLSRITGG